jgi:hypothetical protein
MYYKRELINTVIHEYFHYYLITSESKSNLYQDQLEQFSLEQHPQEILCNTMGRNSHKGLFEKQLKTGSYLTNRYNTPTVTVPIRLQNKS